MRSLRPNLRLLLIALTGYLVMLMPLTFNGAPIYWPDSIAYLHGGSSAVSLVTTRATPYASIERVLSAPQPHLASAPTKEPAAQDIKTPEEGSHYRISAARSVYYAVFIVVTSTLAGPSGPVYVQALLMSLCLIFLAKAACRDADPEKPAIFMLCAIGVTSAGMFSAILLPDFLAPLALLAMGVLFAYWPDLSTGEKLFWYGTLVFSVVSHTTHLAMVFLLLPFAIPLAKYYVGRRVFAPMAVILSALCIGAFCSVLFGYLVERHYGYKPQSFPMVAASVIVDGPGRAFLEQTCPQNGYIYCDYLDRHPTEVDQYLWSPDPTVGVYSLVNQPTREKMSAQQWSLLINTLKNDFWGQFSASFARMMEQLADNSLSQFHYNMSFKEALRTLPPSGRQTVEQSALFNDRFPLDAISLGSQWIGWGALIMVVFMTGRAVLNGVSSLASADEGNRKALVLLTVLVIIGFLINAGLTGAASQPQGRYSARILLLFPVLLAVWAAFELSVVRQGVLAGKQNRSLRSM